MKKIYKNLMKKSLALLLAFMLVIPTLPGLAWATEEDMENLELFNEQLPLDDGIDIIPEENADDIISEEDGEDITPEDDGNDIIVEEDVEEPKSVDEFDEPEELKEDSNEEDLFEDLAEEESNPDELSGPEFIDSPDIYYPKGSLGPFEAVAALKSMRSIGTMSHTGDNGNIGDGQPGSISIDKKETPVPGTSNRWQIELTVTGIDKEKSSDIVLVIDRSGSMGSGGRIASAKNAAIAFVNGLLDDEDNTSTRIALVSFAGDVKVYNPSNPFINASNKQGLINAINSLSASGGTHIQAGLKQARVLLDASEADEKNIVLLGDGAATYSYEVSNPNNYLEYWRTTGNGRNEYRTTSDVPENQFIYSSTVGNGSSENYEYASGGSGNNRYRNYYRNGASAVAEAGFFKGVNRTVYTIDLTSSGDGPWTLENIASPGKDFTASSSDLSKIFMEVAGEISYAATNAVITDPMGTMFSIPGINETNYESHISVSRGSITWDNGTETIRWNLGNISEASPAYMWYVVEIDPSAENGVYYPTNEHTFVDYTNINGEEALKSFPIPEVNIVKEDVPLLTIEKSTEKETYSQVGEIIEYSYTVKNSGMLSIEGPFIVVDDILGNIDTSSAPDQLDPNEFFTVTATHIVSQEDLDIGFIENTAYAAAGNLQSANDIVTVFADQDPILNIEKTADRAKFSEVGEIITYSYKVINRGNVTISEPFEINDDKIGVIDTSLSPDTLAPGEHFTVSATYTVTEEDYEIGYVTNLVNLVAYFGEQDVTAEDELTVTNKETINIHVFKNWTDDYEFPETYSSMNLVNNKPDITIRLFAVTIVDEQEVETQVDSIVLTDGAIYYTFSNKPVFDENENPIQYKISEDSVAGYRTNVSYSMDGDMYVEIQNTLIDYSLTYKANGGTGSEPAPEIYNYNDSVVVKNNMFTRNNYTFAGWNTEPNGSGTSYAQESIFQMPPDNLILYAQWTFNGGGGGTPGGGTPGGGGGGGGTIITDPVVPLADLEKIDHFAYVIGYPDGEVKPGNNITREEVAMIFYRLLTDESRNEWLNDDNPFTDLKGHDWSNRAISTLYNAGIIKGYPDGTFRPSKAITRAEFATIAAKFDELELNYTTKFTDIFGHWAEKYITSSEIKGWIKGYPDNTFKPEQDITRAEAMTLINNVLERAVPEENIHPDAMFWPDINSDDWYFEAVMEATNSHDYIYEEDGDELWVGMKANKIWP